MKLNLLSPWSQTYTIADQELRFYSARSGVLSSFTNLVKDIASACSWVLKNPSDYAGYETKTDKTTNSTVHLGMPLDLKTVDHIESRRSEYVSKVSGILLEESGRKALGQLIVSSLRDVYPTTSGTRGFPSDKDVTDLLDNSDMAVFSALASAAIRANWKAVAEGFPKALRTNLGDKIEQVVDRALEKMGMEPPTQNQDQDSEQ